MNIQLVTRIVTVVVWSAALVGYFVTIVTAPVEQRVSRFWYSFPVLTFILLVIMLFVLFIVPSNVSSEVKNLLSKGVYIYGGFTMLFKEIVAIMRRRMGL